MHTIQGLQALSSRQTVKHHQGHILCICCTRGKNLADLYGARSF